MVINTLRNLIASLVLNKAIILARCCSTYNDLPDIFDNTCDPPKLGIRDVNCLRYADDLVIISESPQGLQQSLNKLQLYCKK